MKLVFSDQVIPQEITKSVFLAGPSPREKSVLDWRIEALKIFEEKGFTGTVFIPIPQARFYGGDDSADWTYDNQIDWECSARAVADRILFWVPRDIKGGMPAFTTNVEFGEDIHTGKILYGRPDNAEKCRYLDKRMEEIKSSKVFNNLTEIIEQSIQILGDGAKRVGGEVYVPLFIWNTDQFQLWYKQLKKNGNRLDNATLKHFLHLPNGYLFSFVLWVKIWVESEQRYKDNEFVFSRKDISTIVPFYRENNETYVVIVKEFRSQVRNENGFVYELPGGSAAKPGENPKENAAHELEEETGLKIYDLDRFVFVSEKQICATLSSHHAFTYKVELTSKEFESVKNDIRNNKVFGIIEDTERTYLEIVPLSKIMEYDLDYAMIGMIYSALKGE